MKRSFIILGVTTLLLAGCGKSDDEIFVGKWDCSSDTTIEFNSDGSFDMYNTKDKNSLDVIGKYSITNKDERDNTITYILSLTTNDRNIEGKKNADEYTTSYSLAIENENADIMAMVNVKNYNMYTCERVKEKTKLN